MKDFEFIEHTADVGIRVFGKNREELFKSASRALFSLLIKYQPKNIKKKEINLEAQDLGELLVNWLNELISLFFAYKFLPGEYNIEIKEAEGRKILRAAIFGEDFDPYERKINREVKAATYHNLKLEETSKGWMAEVIFDI